MLLAGSITESNVHSQILEKFGWIEGFEYGPHTSLENPWISSITSMNETVTSLAIGTLTAVIFELLPGMLDVLDARGLVNQEPVPNSIHVPELVGVEIGKDLLPCCLGETLHLYSR